MGFCKGFGPWASLVAQMVKNLPAVRKTWVQSLGWDNALEKGMVIHASIHSWRIPWTQKPSRHRPWGCRVGHN